MNNNHEAPLRLPAFCPEPPTSSDLDEWHTWAAQAYDTTLPRVRLLPLRTPNAVSRNPLALKATTGRYDDFAGTSLTLHHPLTPEAVTTLYGSLRGTPRAHLTLLPIIRFWTATVAVHAWDRGALSPATFPRRGWYSPADVALTRLIRPATLREPMFVVTLRRLCRAYRDLHPRNEPCACEAQIAAALKGDTTP